MTCLQGPAICEVASGNFIKEKTQYVRNCGALMNSNLGWRGLIVLSAQGYTKFVKCHSGFVDVVRTLLVLRLLCRNAQDMYMEGHGSAVLRLAASRTSASSR